METPETPPTPLAQTLNLENKYLLTGAALLTFLTGFAATEWVFRLLFGRI